jgi:hypothetical protein
VIRLNVPSYRLEVAADGRPWRELAGEAKRHGNICRDGNKSADRETQGIFRRRLRPIKEETKLTKIRIPELAKAGKKRSWKE